MAHTPRVLEAGWERSATRGAQRRVARRRPRGGAGPLQKLVAVLFTIPALTFCGAAETIGEPNTEPVPDPAPITVTVAKPTPAFFVVAPDAGPTTVPQQVPVVLPADPAKHPGPLPPPCPNCPDPRGLPTEPPIEVPR